ncbi:MAG: sugar phosphate isomerase/epimerase family protein [Candidatus Latescibacteria bacterium]|jgi:sugar phosphate isomerase/epimerase|nr:sugar phosphate isomerase/epimerase family protein [Candidatus Latescibacterota bacterium]MDP7447963.1 sugar phosphate isomerase/epimerase family protein [Candidatus Latescibacterota bacterium]HJP33843.1 sugar phosphate isomerase/epimerase family protein [Candidatus Latescibacterota bacterium]
MAIAFNTANLVAQFTDWRFQLSNWGAQDALSARSMTEEVWDSTCAMIRAAGFDAVEVWSAHISPALTDEPRARRFREILDGHGLLPIGAAGGMTPELARVCQWMDMPACNGGFRCAEDVLKIAEATGIAANYENHPEKSAQAILDRIGPDERIGVALDSGWLGTQGVDAVEAVRILGRRIRHVHLKDVKAPGAHETCQLGTGCVNLEGMIGALKEIGYQGHWSWEDEPEDRNPFDIAAATHAWISERV